MLLRAALQPIGYSLTPDELRFALDRHNFTQKDFAEFCGVSQRSVRAWLAGEYPVPGYIVTIVRLLDLLHLHGVNHG